MNAIAIPAGGRWLRRVGWRLLNALQLGFTLGWTAALIPVALLVRALSGGCRLPLRMASWLWAPGLLGGAGARLHVAGAEAVDWTRPCVLVCNHQSVIDICAMFTAVPVPLRFVLKQELAAVPFLGRYARAMGMIFIDRAHARSARNALHEAATQLRGGAVLCAFAEGTRSRDGRVGAFKAGAFQLAIDAGVPVVPVAICGSGRVLPMAGFRVRPGPIRVCFGAPIDTAGLVASDRQKLARQCRDAVVALLEAPHPSPAGQVRPRAHR
jgi:1-acyl-sn-glycerol-3-phosphate acyltransferase